MYFVSSLNSVSYRRVQHISYICVFLTHTIRFLPREKEPQDLPCYSKERGPIQMFPISKSAQSIYAGLGHTLHLHLHLVILQTLLSKATYNWGIHKVIHLEEANRQRKCP